MRTISLILLAATLTAGCATTAGTNRYQTELAELEASCTGRDGILQPTGRFTGIRPQEDYVCRITGGPSDRIQRPGN